MDLRIGFTLRGMPGSASISDPSSDPPPSGLTAMAKNVRDDKVMQVEAGGRLEACTRKGESSSNYFLPCNPFRDITYGRGRWRKFYERAAANNICHQSVESVESVSAG